MESDYAVFDLYSSYLITLVFAEITQLLTLAKRKHKTNRQGRSQVVVENIHSIAHGAGRKWNRQSTRDRIRAKHDDMQQLLKTKLGSTVICPNKDLLYEEAPEAYKDVGTVIDDLQSFGLASVLAELRPVINIKP